MRWLGNSSVQYRYLRKRDGLAQVRRTAALYLETAGLGMYTCGFFPVYIDMLFLAVDSVNRCNQKFHLT